MVLPNRPDKANLIATLGANGKPHPGGLVLAGHTDTVPVDPSLWQSDPFQLRDSDQRFYGLGSCDMKGFLPVALHASAAFVERDLAAPLTIVATSDEESSMAGSRYLLESGKPKADYAIIGEPTAMQPIYAHKGVSMISVQVQGAAGHSSDPSLGHNALETMHPVVGALMQFRDELAQQHQHPSFAVNVPTLNLVACGPITRIESVAMPNCKLICACRQAWTLTPSINNSSSAATTPWLDHTPN